MHKLMLLGLMTVLAAPVAAFAEGSPTPQAPTTASTAVKLCQQAKSQLGPQKFADTYGTNKNKSNAFGKCVSANAKQARQTVANAAQSCKSQQADPGFADAHDGTTFDQYYGANDSKGKGNSRNALGKCVSAAVSQSVTAQAHAMKAAVRSCKQARKSDPTFSATYGTGRNALGKCVAATTAGK